MTPCDLHADSFSFLQRTLLGSMGVAEVIIAASMTSSLSNPETKLLEWAPAIDAMMGVFDRDHILDAVTCAKSASRLAPVRNCASPKGANQMCAFCTIPSIRREKRSKPLEAIVSDARRLMADGSRSV